MKDMVMLLLLTSTALPERQEIGDDVDFFGTFGCEDERGLIITFRSAPNWYGAVDIPPPPLEDIHLRVPVDDRCLTYGRFRDVHQAPPRVLGRKDYSRLDFRKAR